MKYLACDSFQNKEFPDFREICYKHSTRYIIHHTSRGCYEFIGEFIDEKADLILENYKSVYECTEAVIYNPLSIIPFSEHFEELMSGNSKDFYGYTEVYKNN